MSHALRWGILGTGNIAGQFSAGVAACKRGVLSAVGSRHSESAAAFAQKCSIPSAHGTYEELLNARDVDAIYLSLPNSLHHEWTIKALRAGKHVLCEKPFALDLAQSQEMFDVARKSSKLLVEAFMYRSHPQTAAILDTIDSGAIGKVKLIRTSFCYRTTKTSGNVRWDRTLGGGALMDVGCYCLNFSRTIARAEPTQIFATAVMHDSGVDEYAAGTLRFPNDILANFSCGMRVQADNTAYICGEEGYLEIGWPWKPAKNPTFTIARNIPPRQDAPRGTTPTPPPRETKTIPFDGELYGIEADDFAAAVSGEKSPAVSEPDTIGNMRCLDEIRKQIGLQFA